MQLHNKNWFIITCGTMTTYNQEELELLWETLSTAQLDFIQELCESSYNAGYEACKLDA